MKHLLTFLYGLMLIALGFYIVYLYSDYDKWEHIIFSLLGFIVSIKGWYKLDKATL